MSGYEEKWLDLTMAVFDVETTSLDPSTGRIIEIGIVTFKHGKVIDTYNQLIDPEIPIPAVITRVTSLTDKDVKGKPLFKDVADEILKRLTNVALVGYNVNFDKSYVDAELKRVGLSFPDTELIIDPLIIVKELDKSKGRKKLGVMCEKYGIKLENAHRASNDAEATGHLLYKLGEVYRDQLPEETDAFVGTLNAWRLQQDAKEKVWKSKRNQSENVLSLSNVIPVGLGATYIQGKEVDPLRALYLTVPEAEPPTEK